MPVKSVYNFVPAPEEKDVFKPDWAEQVSHDIPFSDGESGEIELKITAMTPIFVRNGHSKGQEENEFSHYIDENGNKKYFIPATSLKGMFRNVLEILSSSKLNKRLVDNARYSFRDLTRDSLYMKSYKSSKVKAGWLREEKDGSWVIEECKNLYHIHHEEVDKALDTDFRQEFLNKNPNDKTAKYKYDKGPSDLKLRFKVQDVDGKEKAIFDRNGNIAGRIVFTGQSGKRKEGQGRPSGKVYEFVFTNETVGSVNVSPAQKNDFKFIYLDHDPNNISQDWKYWRAKLKGDKIPVFFTMQGNTLKHFGLAFMYKLPYRYSVHEMKPLNGYQDEMDFAETIFGKIEESNSLKGRVYIGNAFSNNSMPEDKICSEIFGAPKASYYPFYIKQTNVDRNGYTTYEDKGTIRGFKRYPVHSKILKKIYSTKQLQNPKIFSQFVPLGPGANFKVKIRFHNLRRIEIGGLLSAITFHDNLDSCYHSLGGAKPFGFGKIKIIDLATKYLKDNEKEYLREFEKAVGENNIESNLRELLAMASNTEDTTLDYPILDSDRNINQFLKYKSEKEYLHPFSTVNQVKVLTIREKDKEYKQKQAEKDESFRKQQAAEEENTMAEQLKDSSNLESLKSFVDKYPHNKNVSLFLNKIDELNKMRRNIEADEMAKQVLQFENCDFAGTKNQLNGLLRKNKQFRFSVEQCHQIEQQLRCCWEKDNKAFWKKNKVLRFNEFPWTDIKKWLGEEKAKSLFDELLPK